MVDAACSKNWCSDRMLNVYRWLHIGSHISHKNHKVPFVDKCIEAIGESGRD